MNVRSEDELFRGRLTKEVLELFMKVLQRISDCLHLNVAVSSKTVGVALGQSESVGGVEQRQGRGQRGGVDSRRGR